MWFEKILIKIVKIEFEFKITLFKTFEILKISKESKYKRFKRVLVYSYNKKEVREGRKMGHLNFINE